MNRRELMTPERFVEDMLGQIWRQFYPSESRRFYQDRPMLIQAITWPARWMNDRGAKAPPSTYRRILNTVITAIRQKGNVARIRRFSVYFLHSVQEHMKHHGEDYYETAKAARPIAAILPAATRHVRPGAPPDRTTETLAQLNRIVRPPGGRRRRTAARQPELPTFPPIFTGK